MKRSLIFRLGTILLLILIAVLMMIVGRGHTVYFDNKAFEYEGKTYQAFPEVCINSKDTEEQFLYPRERGMVSVMGQKCKVHFEYIPRKGSMSSEVCDAVFDVPYSMDGMIVNLPAYFAGLPEEAWLSEFVPIPATETEKDNSVITDEFSMESF